ncbi:hypothetical protein [Neobacillus niacini]|uniref:hypothetical protein n=1 Tax=Neobacillus niacini TaxID=86668 RepID=UPI001470C8D5|nr:hypothetical protein [Neobacillus niacini]
MKIENDLFSVFFYEKMTPAITGVTNSGICFYLAVLVEFCVGMSIHGRRNSA